MEISKKINFFIENLTFFPENRKFDQNLIFHMNPFAPKSEISLRIDIFYYL